MDKTISDRVSADLDITEQIAAKLRQEPYRLFRNDCLTKSLRLRSECRKRGFKAHLVWCALGLAKVKAPVIGEIPIPICTHFWGEVHGRRFETSRPLGSHGSFGVVPSEIKPVFTIKC